jgi:hypothetical protein
MLRAIFAIFAITIGCCISVSTAPTAAACPPGDYQGSSGDCVPDPTAAPSAPPSATALCRDGDWSFSEHHAGTCSGHGGVAQWCPCGGTVAPASAYMPDPNSPDLDSRFLRLLTTDPINPTTVWNFPLVKTQGLQLCQQMDNGERQAAATNDLMAAGPYSFDDAATISAAAVNIYCPSHLPPSAQ